MGNKEHDTPSHRPYYYEDDEITLKELILKLQEFAREIWSNKFVIAAVSIFIAGLFIANTLRKDVIYESAISFTLLGGKTKPTVAYSPYGDMEFGFVESNKIKELARSSRIMYNVLLSFVSVDGKSDFISNHLIDIYQLNQEWSKENVIPKLSLDAYRFTTSDLRAFKEKDFRAINTVHELTSGNTLKSEKGLVNLNYDDKSDIFNLNVKSLNSDLSDVLSKLIYDELSDFYLNETVAKPKEAFEKISNEADSTLILLNSTERKLAFANDRNRGLTSSINQININKLSSEVERLRSAYNQLFESKQRLAFSLSQDQADFQIIDQTYIPIPEKPSLLKNTLIGLFLGAFLSTIYIIGRKIILDAMAS